MKTKGNTITKTDSVWFTSKGQWQCGLVYISVSMMLLILTAFTGPPKGASTPGIVPGLTARAAAHVNDAFTSAADLNATRGPRAFASLPLAAQAAISTTLGRDNCSYHALPSPAGFQAQNRPHGLEVAFTRGGVTSTSTKHGPA
jgi:hypothetical protein